MVRFPAFAIALSAAHGERGSILLCGSALTI